MDARLSNLLDKETPSKRRYLCCALRWLKDNGYEVKDQLAPPATLPEPPAQPEPV